MPRPPPDDELKAINEALLIASVRQHELTEEAERLNVQLRAEIAERQRVEDELRDSEERFRAIADNIPQLAWMADRNGTIDWFNRGWLEYTGTTLQENLGSGWKAVLHPDHVDAMVEKFERHLRAGLEWEDTFPLRGKDGTYRWFLSRMNVIRDGPGKIVRFFGTNTDITNERRIEERQKLLIAELAHRSQNLLSVIKAIATQSLSGRRPLSEEREALARRISALGRSQSALIGEGFEGAHLSSVIGGEIAGFSSQIEVNGPDLLLTRSAVQTFCLALHELATNAMKHGALSVPNGHVSIQWSIEGASPEARFKFCWQEFDGPPVVPPTRVGFGSHLLDNAVRYQLGTQPKVTFAPEGLIYELDAPVWVITGQ